MGLNLSFFEKKAKEATIKFWNSREVARRRQIEFGTPDHGERAGVTAGKNMDGFITLMLDIIKENGLDNAEIHLDKAFLTLPGFFRPTKTWDILVLHRKRLVAALELKSQVGPSFGNNFNNRTEEAIGAAHDFWTAYREGAFGKHPRPFLGWMIMVEDSPKSRQPVKNNSPHYSVFPEFNGRSYLERYDLLCQKLAQEQLYSAATVITSTRNSIISGDYSELSELTSLKNLITSLAGHIAAEAARG